MEDMMAPPRQVPILPRPTTILGWLKYIAIYGLNAFKNYAKWGILMGLFLFKFAEWWYSPANTSTVRKLPVPPPPSHVPPARNGISLPSNATLCPLCLQERTSPAATPAGYVFCYSCLIAYVSNHQKCPVSGVGCEVNEVRKVYES